MAFTLSKSLQNILSYSEGFDQSAFWVVGSDANGPSVTLTNSFSAPNRTFSATKITERTDTIDSTHHIVQYFNVTSDGEYTFSVFAKDAGRDLNLRLYDGASAAFIRSVVFNVSVGSYHTETGSGSSHITEYPDGWWRCGLHGTTGASANSMYIQLMLHDGTTFTYSGDGTSGVYVWGAQATYGDAPEQYTQTTTDGLLTDAEFVAVTPEYDYKCTGKKIEDRHRTRSGASYVYKWGDYDAFKMSVMYVDSEFKSIVNSWWNTNVDLVFTEDRSFVEYNVRLVNKAVPVSQPVKPYDNLFKGTIELETY